MENIVSYPVKTMSHYSSTKRPFRFIGATIALSSAALIGAAASPASAAVPPPTIDYQFDNNLTDSASGSTATESATCTAGQVDDPCIVSTNYGSDNGDNYWQWTTSSEDGGGLRIVTNAPVTDTYTVILKFSFSDIGPDAGYRKIIDYKDRGTDNGFYTYEDYIYFYNLGDGSDAFGRYFSANEVIDLIIVRDGTTDRFMVYLRSAGGGLGDPVIDIDDSADNESVFSDSGAGSVIGLFFDDESTDGEGGPGGKAYQFTAWSGVALTVDQLNEALGIQTAAPDYDDYRLPPHDVVSESLPNTGSDMTAPLVVLAAVLTSVGLVMTTQSRRTVRI